MGSLVGSILSIILLDLVLSGDNAIVIGSAASMLPLRQRNIAILIGGAGAILMRIVFTGFISWLLNVPFLQLTGGIVLIFISIRLLTERSSSKRKVTHVEAEMPSAPTRSRRHLNFFFVLLTIMLADMTTSLDNIIAVGALANGNLLVLSIGLFVSVSVLLVGSALIARISERIPWLLDLATVLLALTAANTILADNGLSDALVNNLYFKIAIFAVATGIVLLTDGLLFLSERRHKVKAAN